MNQIKVDEVPSVAHVLETFAYHVSCFMTEGARGFVGGGPGERAPRRFGLGLGSYGPGCPAVHVDVEIRPTNDGVEGGDWPWGVWAQVWMALHGAPLRCVGNRCGGRDEYARLCAPVLEWVAAYHVAKK